MFLLVPVYPGCPGSKAVKRSLLLLLLLTLHKATDSCVHIRMYVRNTDEEHECLSNPAGRGYTGTVNVTVSGKPCAPWIQVPAEFSFGLPDETTRDALNYCRYIPGQQWTGTSCAVRTKSGFHLQRCGVPYCGGTELYYLLLKTVC